MVDIDRKEPQPEVASRLLKLMLLRVLFVSLLLGVSVFIQARETRTYFGEIQTLHYFLIATIYFLTFVYILLFKCLKNYSRQAYIQLLADTFFITAVIYSTGGIESIFSFLYILTIINASIIIYRRGGMIIASSSSILYGLLLDLQYYGIITPLEGRSFDFPGHQSSYVFYTIAVNIAAFYLVAFLSSFPSEQARKSRIELKEKEHDIIKLEALNEWIIKSITSGLITLDDQERVILFNPEAEGIFNIRSTDVIGERIGKILPFLNDYIQGRPGIHEKRKNDSGRVTDISYKNSEGKHLVLRFFISPLQIPDGDRKGRILFFQDITEMKEIEEEMKKVEGLALVGELAAAIAHEIRNPMASISGSIQLLKEGMETDNMSNRLMGIILREINRLNNLINDFLLFARPNPSEFREIDLSALVLEALELFKNSGKWQERIKVRTVLDNRIKLCSDPEKIRQVLWNLFLNAVEAISGEGFIEINTFIISSEDTENPDGDMVGIKVRDSGKGFDENALAHLFTPFFTTKEGGTGLGLAIIKRIVEGLQGRITGENHPEGGAIVTVFLKKVIT